MSGRKRPAGRISRATVLFMALVMVFSMTGCVKYEKSGRNDKVTEVDPDKAVIVATSAAVVDICDRMDIPLAGVPETKTSKLPKRYRDLQKVGTAMSPDMEKVAALRPDWILSPTSLMADLKPKYEAINADYAFMNLSSTDGMFKSIEELGDLFQRQDEAEKLVADYEKYCADLEKRHQGDSKPKVLILMGLPGSYVAATPQSYVGSLVEMAGGVNVYSDEKEDFINVNTEDMLKKDPDIILRTAHAVPDEVMEMFDREFRTNDIWKHFDAVKEDRVYDLPYSRFGMSAGFGYKKAIACLEPLLYGQENAK